MATNVRGIACSAGMPKYRVFANASAIAISGVSDAYTTGMPLRFQRPPNRRLPSPLTRSTSVAYLGEHER